MNTTTTHTAGPWTIQPDPEPGHRHPYCQWRHITNGARFDSFSENHGWVLDREDGKIICDLRDGEEMQANARLIATAPELLAACKAALDAAKIDADDGDLALEALSEIRAGLAAAIAKAEGMI